MATYRVHFVDRGGKAFAVHEVDCPDDEAAIEKARSLNGRFIGMGFDLWEGDRLVHEERR